MQRKRRGDAEGAEARFGRTSRFEVRVAALGTGTAHPGCNRDKPCARAGTF